MLLVKLSRRVRNVNILFARATLSSGPNNNTLAHVRAISINEAGHRDRAVPYADNPHMCTTPTTSLLAANSPTRLGASADEGGMVNFPCLSMQGEPWVVGGAGQTGRMAQACSGHMLWEADFGRWARPRPMMICRRASCTPGGTSMETEYSVFECVCVYLRDSLHDSY